MEKFIVLTGCTLTNGGLSLWENIEKKLFFSALSHKVKQIVIERKRQMNADQFREQARKKILNEFDPTPGRREDFFDLLIGEASTIDRTTRLQMEQARNEILKLFTNFLRETENILDSVTGKP